jgi:hypothetical protein
MTEYEHFGLVFTKARVYKFGHRTLELQLELGNIFTESAQKFWYVLSIPFPVSLYR